MKMLEREHPDQEQILLADDTPALKHGGWYFVANNQVNRDKLLRQYELDSYPFTEDLINVLLLDIERVFGGVV